MKRFIYISIKVILGIFIIASVWFVTMRPVLVKTRCQKQADVDTFNLTLALQEDKERDEKQFTDNNNIHNWLSDTVQDSYKKREQEDKKAIEEDYKKCLRRSGL